MMSLRPAAMLTCALMAIGAASALAQTTPRRVRVHAATYVPFYRASDGGTVSVSDFDLDVDPVTNEEFASFVAASPRWSRDRVPALFADDRYLSHWPNAAGPAGADRTRPVTYVSWFAASAYCRWAGAAANGGRVGVGGACR